MSRRVVQLVAASTASVLAVTLTGAVMLLVMAACSSPAAPIPLVDAPEDWLVVMEEGSTPEDAAEALALGRDATGVPLDVPALADSPLAAIGVYPLGPLGRSQRDSLARVLRMDDRIERIEPDLRVGLIEPVAEPMTLTLALDPLVGQQYQHALTGSPAAWSRGVTGSGGVVAIIDTGIDCTHPDLACVPGRDFVNAEPPDDDHGHGTHVAGIAAAVGGNGLLGSGIAPLARVMPVKVLSSGGYGSTSTIAEAILWASEQPDVDALNLSLGGPQPSVTLERAVEAAALRGRAVVCAAGNDGSSRPGYPASYAGCIGVAATDSQDRPASFTSHGPNADVAFPGVSILSTCRGGGMCSMSGTSMAAPGYAGSLALLMAGGLSSSDALRVLVTTGKRLTAAPLAGLTRPDLDAATIGQPVPTLRPTGAPPTATPFPPGGTMVPPPYPGGSPTATRPVPTSTAAPSGCRVEAVTADSVLIRCAR